MIKMYLPSYCDLVHKNIYTSTGKQVNTIYNISKEYMHKVYLVMMVKKKKKNNWRTLMDIRSAKLIFLYT